jgi:hypothetical protein
MNQDNHVFKVLYIIIFEDTIVFIFLSITHCHRRFLKPKAAGFGWRHANLNLFLKEKRFSFSFATKAAPSVVSERVDCWLPHRLPTNIAHQYRLPTPISRSGSVFICQDSLWHLREVIRSGRPCSPWKSGDMRSTTPYVSSNHPMSKFTAHNQPLESVTSTEQDHSKESFFSRVKWINTQSGYIRVRRTWNKARKCHIFFLESIITFRSH